MSGPRERRPPRGGRLVLAVALLGALVAGCAEPQEATPVATDDVAAGPGWRFVPEAAEVDVGATVTWTNRDNTHHTVTFDDGFDEVLAPGDSTSRTFDAAGEHAYRCRYHLPDMQGRVVVTR